MRDWDSIKQAYVQGRDGLRALAKKHNVSFHSLAFHSRNEHWPLQRRLFQEPVARAAPPPSPAGQSLPERSALLRARVISELERDAALVSEKPPQSLADSEQRQAVLSAVTRNAGVVLQWDDKTPTPLIRVLVVGNSVAVEGPPDALPADEITEQ